MCTNHQAKEGLDMVRVNLFESAGPGLYGTATAVDVIHVSLAAVGFCVAAGAVTYLVVCFLLSLK
jgi:hypothetical protein